MIERYYEVVCDFCGCADHYKQNPTKSFLQDMGWICVRGKHFCDEDCYKKYIEK